MIAKKKKPGPKKGTGGRPEKSINWEEIDKLCSLQCTLREIAVWVGCSEDTIERRCKDEMKMTFAEYFRSKRTLGYISLRRNQFRLSERHPSMAMFLGKNYLGQTDKQQIELISVNDIMSALNSIQEGLGDQVEKILLARLGNGNGNGNNH